MTLDLKSQIFLRAMPRSGVRSDTAVSPRLRALMGAPFRIVRSSIAETARPTSHVPSLSSFSVLICKPDSLRPLIQPCPSYSFQNSAAVMSGR